MSVENDLRSPAYLALNPEGKVPTLMIDGRPLTEVAAILHYLAKPFPDAGLLPRDDIEADAQALSWMSFAASTLHPARTRGLDHAREVWGIADRRLGSGWVLGRYSIADIHLFRLYWRFANSLKPAPQTFPPLAAHYLRIIAPPPPPTTKALETPVREATAAGVTPFISRSEKKHHFFFCSLVFFFGPFPGPP